MIFTINSLTSADFDLDNDVDGSDFLGWQRGFGITSGATLSDGDADSDDDVDANDLGIWQQDFGISENSTIAAGVNVPEPPSVVHALFTLLMTLQALGNCRFFSDKQ